MSKDSHLSYYPLDLEAVPPSWNACLIRDVINDIQTGFACGEHNNEGIGLPHIRPMNIDRNGRFDLSVIKYVSPDNELRLSRGDVLFNNTNSPELIGKTAYIGSDKEFAFSNHMTRLRHSVGIDPKFLAYQLHYLWMSGYFRHRCTHHVNQASISSEPLANTVPFLLAPEKEQEKIVNEIEKQLTRLDAAVEALKRVRANLKRYRASVLKAAVEGRLVPTEAELARQERRSYEPASDLLKRILKERRAKWEAAELAKMKAKDATPKDDRWKSKYHEPTPPDTSNLTELPEGWVWANLEQISWDSGYGTSIKCGYDGKGISVLRIPNIIAGNIDTSDLKLALFDLNLDKGELLNTNDILIVRTNGSIDLIGRGALVDKTPLKPTYFASYLIRYRLLGSSRLGGWLNNYFKSPYVRRMISALAATTAGQYNLNLDKLNSLAVPIPPDSEQKRIFMYVDTCLSNCDAQERIINICATRSDSLHQSILKRAFEGRLVPQDSNDEPASVLLERIKAERESIIVSAGRGRKAGRRAREKEKPM